MTTETTNDLGKRPLVNNLAPAHRVDRIISCLLVALLATMAAGNVLASADLPNASISGVLVLPTCAITPHDRVIIDVRVSTSNTPAFIVAPSEVVIEGNDILVRVIVDSGISHATNKIQIPVDLGQFPLGEYNYTIELNPPPENESHTASGSFAVVSEHCPPPPGETGRIYWADPFGRSFRSAFTDGSNISSFPTGYIGIFAVDANHGKIYWSYNQRIRRANLNGSDEEVLILAEPDLYPTNLMLDPPSAMIYWIESDFTGTSIIRRASVGGADIEELVTGLSRARLLTLDTAAGKMYWFDDGMEWVDDGLIQRANLDGSDVQDLVGELDSVSALVLDGATAKMYWASLTSIHRANLDGTDPEDLITSGLSGLWSQGLALDMPAAKMYWADSAGGKIQRANLDGTEVEDLVTMPSFWHVRGVKPGLVPGKMYWTTDTRMQRASLDGTEVEDVIAWGEPHSVTHIPFVHLRPIVEAAGPRHVSVTPLPHVFPTEQAIRVTSPDWPCLDKYLSTSGEFVEEPEYAASGSWGTVIFNDGAIPGSTYVVDAEIRGAFAPGGTVTASASTSVWGDVVGTFDGEAWTPPDSIVTILDAVAILDRFANLPTAPPVRHVDLIGMDNHGIDCIPDQVIHIIDIVMSLAAFQGLDFEQTTGCARPCP